MSVRDRYQGLCLEASEGWRHMGAFDFLRPEIRNMLTVAKINVCPACVITAMQQRYIHLDDIHGAARIIKEFEDMVLKCE